MKKAQQIITQAKERFTAAKVQTTVKPERRTKNLENRFEEGTYYRIIMRPRSNFVSVRSETPTGLNKIQQINGKAPNGQWSTQSWLVRKDGARIENEVLIGDTKAIRSLLKALNGIVQRTKGDEFKVIENK